MSIVLRHLPVVTSLEAQYKRPGVQFTATTPDMKVARMMVEDFII